MLNPNKEQLVKILKSRQWWVQVFNGLPLYLHTVASNTGWMIKKITGVNYSHFFLRMHELRAHYYYDQKDLATIGEGYYRKNQVISQIHRYMREHKNNYLAARRKTGHIGADRLAKLNLNQLIDLGQKLCHELTMAIGITHAIEGISFASEQKLKNLLDKRGLNSHENFQTLSAPSQSSFLSQAQAALWQINHSPKTGQKKLINNFLKNFGWIENSYVKGKTLTAAGVLAKAKQQKHHPSASALAKTTAAKKKLVAKLSLTRQEIFVVQTIATATHWQDERKKFLMQTIGRFEPVIEKIAKTVGLSPEVLKYIHSHELTYHNLSDKQFLTELAGRYPSSCYYALKNKILVYPGSQAAYIEKQLEQNDHKKISQLKGMIACPGLVRGRVKICRTIHDIPKVRKGEILVASMTRPEFLPAMQKAVGFITDEGGITSHASIISREMNKPCIIGTKIATEVLKDGDMVELDANKGIVRKI